MKKRKISSDEHDERCSSSDRWVKKQARGNLEGKALKWQQSSSSEEECSSSDEK